MHGDVLIVTTIVCAERAVASGAGQFEVFGMKQTRESFSDELRKRTSGVGSAQVCAWQARAAA